MSQPKDMLTEPPPHNRDQDNCEDSQSQSESDRPFQVNQIVWVKVKGH